MEPAPVLPDPAPVETASPADLPQAIHQVHRRPLGLHPIVLLATLGGLWLLAAIVLLAEGSLAPGLVFLGMAIASFALFFGGARRDPTAPAARATMEALARGRSLAGVGAVRARAWSRTGRDLMRIRTRQQRLRRELKATLAPLGEAVHQDDHPREQALRRRATDLEEQLSETDRQASAAVAAARQEIEREQATVERTQPLSTVPGERPQTGLNRKL